jgi:xanthine/CO dehydrogenase XdhC/CoxF family maturation factor
MNRRETEHILDALRTAHATGARAAVATVVRVRGSAYRREGARILIREDGSYECLLSGGCLEPAVADAAAQVIATGKTSLREYDLEEDSIWSLGVGCTGSVDILIERIEDDPIWRAWVDILDQAEPAVLVKPLTDSHARLLVRERDTSGSLGNANLDALAVARARHRLRTSFPQSGPDRAGDTELFFEVSVPPPELVVFGAGSDVEPLARQAWDLGFSATVVDAREAFLTAGRFPHATRIRAHFAEFGASVRLSERSSVVIMNHHLERDRESLRFAIESPAAYVGVLGPRSRFARLLQGLREEGYVPETPRLSRVRSPIGLALGAEPPEEIARSILGEILALQRGFDGGFLQGRETTLHRPAETNALARS